MQAPALAETVRSKIQRVLNGGQNAESEEVELDQAHPGTAVLVPLQDCALVHPTSLDRAHFAHRPLGEHHAAGVNAQMPRSSEQLISKINDRLRYVVIAVGRDAPVGVDLVDQASCWPVE